jgi:hypothetical protein
MEEASLQSALLQSILLAEDGRQNMSSSTATAFYLTWFLDYETNFVDPFLRALYSASILEHIIYQIRKFPSPLPLGLFRNDRYNFVGQNMVKGRKRRKCDWETRKAKEKGKM